MQTVTLEEAKERLNELVEQVQTGEEFIITREARPFARLLPVTGGNGHPLANPPGERETTSPELGADHPGSDQPESAEAKSDEGHAHLLGMWKGKIEIMPGWDEPEDFGPDYR